MAADDVMADLPERLAHQHIDLPGLNVRARRRTGRNLQDVRHHALGDTLRQEGTHGMPSCNQVINIIRQGLRRAVLCGLHVHTVVRHGARMRLAQKKPPLKSSQQHCLASILSKNSWQGRLATGVLP